MLATARRCGREQVTTRWLARVLAAVRRLACALVFAQQVAWVLATARRFARGHATTG
ncbi:hypothetical protein [Amycolatopsis sp. AA4]|uniref:hypothetical protein n=1 Tax=Amycolatopsis sp. AA4 TaxID=1896961 RepID=UPI0002E0893B|nr:hypothetical protein [Amycolatopsis sp. AA4]